MKKRSMMDIHLDSLAFAAGVVPPAHLAVSHAPDIRRAPRRRFKNGLRVMLLALASSLNRFAVALDAPHAGAYHKPCT